ncbi:MAG: ABC transporter permease [Clostridiales bacterium]|jgi:multidrug/hemolysin transport system permease protein|nr:ABC transporter permease [Clostridiales bacterium]
MKRILLLTRRNIKVYAADKTAFFFTFLSPLIVIFLNVVFLRDIQIDSINSMLGGLPADGSLVARIADGWLFSGITAVSCLTVALNSAIVRVRDGETGVSDDFDAAPVPDYVKDFAYALASFFISVIICALILTAGFAFLAVEGAVYSAGAVLGAYVALAVSCMFSAAFMSFIMRFFKTQSASGAFSGIMSAASGFLIGAYMPLSFYGEGMRNALSLFPFAHSAALFRKFLMEESVRALASATAPEAGDAVMNAYDFELKFFGTDTTPAVLWGYLSAAVFVFAGLNVLIFFLNKRARNRPSRQIR